jgi:hypothetical protein
MSTENIRADSSTAQFTLLFQQVEEICILVDEIPAELF